MELEQRCEHPKLASWTDSLSGDHCHQCMSCGDKIIIPAGTSTENEDGMICFAFGLKWSGRAAQVLAQRTD